MTRPWFTLRLHKDTTAAELARILQQAATLFGTGPLRLRCRLNGPLIVEEVACD